MSFRRRTSSRVVQSANADMPPIARLWLLRMMVLLGGHWKFVNSHNFENDEVATALGLEEMVNPVVGDFSAKLARANLRQLHAAAERKLGKERVPSCLSNNVQRLAQLVGLSAADCRILEFAVLVHSEQLLADASEFLDWKASRKLVYALSVVLDLPESEVRHSLDAKNVLSRSGLVSMDRSSSSYSPTSLSEKLTLQSAIFADHMVCSEADPITLLRETVHASTGPELALADFAHVAPALSILRPYLQHAVNAGRKGVNIYLHGLPGTGKNQLAKVLAQAMACELFEVASQDEGGDPVDGQKRLRAFRTAQSLLSSRKAMILFDEAEDVFDDGDNLFGRKSTAQTRKAWVNRILEDNAVPTIWLSNAVRGLDAAFVRRFDMVLELPVPPKKQRERIIQAASGGLLDATQISRLSESELLTPAVVARACAVVQTISTELAEPDAMGAANAIELLVGNTLQAQGHAVIRRDDPNRLPGTYDPAFVHADANLVQIAEGLVKTKSGRLCLYGPPGTGKTAFGRWLAAQMGAPMMVKRASDLMSMWVGGSEKNLAQAFRQAEQQGALLLIDEVDSFLQDRRGAHASWEVSQVNEMLTQMESFPGVFIASTNLMAGLDQAALRRFDLKVKIDFLQPSQAKSLLCSHCAAIGLPEPAPAVQARINALRQLTPGDFAAVARQHRFCPMASANDFVTALAAECALKEGNRAVIGFV